MRKRKGVLAAVGAFAVLGIVGGVVGWQAWQRMNVPDIRVTWSLTTDGFTLGTARNLRSHAIAGVIPTLRFPKTVEERGFAVGTTDYKRYGYWNLSESEIDSLPLEERVAMREGSRALNMLPGREYSFEFFDSVSSYPVTNLEFRDRSGHLLKVEQVLPPAGQ